MKDETKTKKKDGNINTLLGQISKQKAKVILSWDAQFQIKNGNNSQDKKGQIRRNYLCTRNIYIKHLLFLNDRFTTVTFPR